MKKHGLRLAFHALFLGALLLFPGCGEDFSKWAGNAWETATGTNPKLGDLEYRVVTQGTLKEDSEGLFGIGDIVFVKALKNDNLFTIKFALEERGSLSLVANSDEKLDSGLKITFTRIDRLVRMQVETSPGGKKFIGYDETQKILPLRLDPTKPMTLEIDIHAHGHFSVRANGEKSAQIGFEEVDGLFAGLILHGVKVTDVKASPASRH